MKELKWKVNVAHSFKYVSEIFHVTSIEAHKYHFAVQLLQADARIKIQLREIRGLKSISQSHSIHLSNVYKIYNKIRQFVNNGAFLVMDAAN